MKQKGPPVEPPTFEEAYSRHEFSELVRLTIACADMLRRFLDRKSTVAAADQDQGAVQDAPGLPVPDLLKP
jgi:hypothetical protein